MSYCALNQKVSQRWIYLRRMYIFWKMGHVICGLNLVNSKVEKNWKMRFVSGISHLLCQCQLWLLYLVSIWPNFAVMPIITFTGLSFSSRNSIMFKIVVMSQGQNLKKTWEHNWNINSSWNQLSNISITSMITNWTSNVNYCHTKSTKNVPYSIDLWYCIVKQMHIHACILGIIST